MDGAALVHNRTAMFLYPAAIEKLYAACRASRVRHIICLEWCGYSHELGRFYEFTAQRQPSAALRSTFFVHDYPNMLREAGYRTTSMQIKRVPMRKPIQQDAHLLCLTATRA